MITVKIEGLDELKNGLDSAVSDIPQQINWAMVQSVNVVKNSAQDYAPYKTGTLRRSIYTDVQDNGFTGIVAQDPDVADYGVYMEYGTGPHIIEAINKRVLADQSMNLIFGKIVHHPGTAPRPFMSPAIEDNIDTIQGYFSEAVKRLIDTIANS